MSTNPDAPTSLTQTKVGGTAIGVAEPTDQNSVLLGAVLRDAGLSLVRLQVEVKAVGTTFADSPTHSSPFVSNGQAARITAAALADGAYHWQCRTMDVNGATSPWVSFGGNDETEADFTVANVADLSPMVSSSAEQYRSDGVTVIAVGGSVSESRVLIKASVTDDSGWVRLQVERRPVATAFTGTASIFSSDFVTSGSEATVEMTGIATGHYHWQYRAQDVHGGTSTWTSFDPMGTQVENPPTNPASADFAVNTSLNTVPSIPVSAHASVPTGGTTTDDEVTFQAMVSDPDGDGVRLQVEVRPQGAMFFGTPSGESVLIASGAVASLEIAGMANGPYQWQYRAVDGSGAASAWTLMGGVPDFTVAVSSETSQGVGDGGGGSSGGCGVSTGAGSPVVLFVLGLVLLIARRMRT